jgi:cell wall-associated NlpC family hydrolase
MFFSSCSATSNSQRFKQNKSERWNKSGTRYNTPDTAKISSKSGNSNSFIADTTQEFDDLPTIEKDSDKSKIVANIEKLKSFNIALTPREKILLEIIKFLDTPYQYGGKTGDGMDCSAFTGIVYKNSMSIDLPRSSREQYKVGDDIDKDELKFGDLVFFNTTRRSKPGHVGIFIGENQFVHASRKLGVTVSSLDDAYYKKRYMGARRIDQIEQ